MELLPSLTETLDFACPFVVIDASTGHGAIGLDRDLGFEGLRVTNAFSFRHTLSAHATSTVELHVIRPTRIRGFLNGTAPHCNGATFEVDDDPLGIVHRPYDLTRETRLDPGRHRLRIHASNSQNSCHTVWGFDGPLTLDVPPPFYVAIGAICKDENTYLAEWIRHHLAIGVSHIFLLDNDSQVPLSETVADHDLTRHVTVEAFEERGVNIQNSSYLYLLRRFGPSCRWMALIDIDEYIVPKLTPSLPRLLSAFEDYGGLLVQWVMFGSNGLQAKPNDPLGSFTDSYVDPHVKSIVQPRFVANVPNPHRFEYLPGRGDVTEHFDATPSTMHVQLNHYWTRSRSEWAEKIARTPMHPHFPRSWEDFDRHQRRCIFRDTSIQRLRTQYPPTSQPSQESHDAHSPLVYGFIHVAAVNHWQAILRSQLHKIQRSGLYDRTARIYIGVVGTSPAAMNAFDDIPAKVQIAFCRPRLADCEYPTLETLQNVARSEACYIWYIHSKGVTNPHSGQTGWRNKMEEFVLVHHDLASAKLDQGYMVAAGFGSDDPRWPIPGNFWWSKSEHLASLPDVRSLDWGNRWNAERWVIGSHETDIYFHDCGDTRLDYLRIRDCEAGAGRLTTNGFHSWLRRPVLIPKEWTADHIVSCHAPSYIEVDVTVPACVFGFVCQSGRHNGWTLCFDIDGAHHYMLSAVGERTDPLVLQPGRHVLRILVTQGEKWGAHTGWGLVRPGS